VVGVWGGIAGLAVASGPLIGGAVTQWLSWHWIFWVNVPTGIVAAIGARLRLSESRWCGTRLDIPALLLVSGGVGALIWGLVQAAQAGWGSAQTLVAPWIVSVAGTASGYGSYVLPFIIAGTGISMALPAVSAAGLNAVSPASLGKAAGILNTLQQFGAVLGIAIVTAVFNSRGSLAGQAAVTNGYRPALAVSAALSVLGAVAAFGIRRTARARAVDPSRDPSRPGEAQPADLATVWGPTERPPVVGKSTSPASASPQTGTRPG
jgi:MFS family permease